MVHYDCPECDVHLKSPITDAGKTDSCPDCKRVLVVPGLEERERAFRAEQAAALEKEAAAKKRKQEAAAEKQKQEQIAKKAQEERERAELATLVPPVVQGQSKMEQHTNAANMNCPKRQESLDGLAAFAGTIGGLGIVLAFIIGFATLIVFASKDAAVKSYVGSLVSLVVMTLISSLLWFIIAGALRAFDHLIDVAEFTADRMANIERSLRKMAASGGGLTNRDGE